MFCMALVSGTAQETKWGVGINIGYGTDVSKPFLGAKAHYDITDAFTVAASFNHYFKETVDLGEFGAAGVEGKLNVGISTRIFIGTSSVMRFLNFIRWSVSLICI